MSNTNPNIYFRQNEFTELSKIYDNQYNDYVRNANEYFASVNDWNTFNLLIFNSKYEQTFSSLLNSYLNNSFFVQPINDSCRAFQLDVDEAYYFSIFQSEPLFYISIFFGILFLSSLFFKHKSLKIVLLLIFLGSNIGNLINFFIVEKEIIENIKNEIKNEDCEESIYRSKFQNKYIELNKNEPYRYYGQ